MCRARRSAFLVTCVSACVSACVISLSFLGDDSAQDQLAKTHCARPLYCVPCPAPHQPGLNTIILFDEENFGGAPEHRYTINLSRVALNTLHVMTPYIGRAESAAWNVAPGYIVVLYQHTDAKKPLGKQFVMFGNGGQANLDDAAVHNTQSSFAIYYVGT